MPIWDILLAPSLRRRHSSRSRQIPAVKTMDALEFCKVGREGRLTIVTLNRPDVMNALHFPAHWELAKVFDDFAADPEQWAAIITGAGDRAFCAGNDLKATAASGQSISTMQEGDAPLLPPSGFAGLCTRFDLTKPVIAAVNGVALGGGFETALASDLIIASDKATFGLPEPRVGLVAGAGGIHRLPRAIGTKRAMGMMLTGRHVGAAEGKDLGFVNEVVPHAELMDGARRWAKIILDLAPLSIRASKEASYKGLDVPLEQALATKYPGQVRLMNSEDAREGPRAFAEKRKPQWKGR